ncbi:MAG: bifunctional diguanylate cyclase/phosphodiesterase [Pseudomonadota bacterium]
MSVPADSKLPADITEAGAGSSLDPFDAPPVPEGAVVEAKGHEVAYIWDLQSDALTWQANAATALRLDQSAPPATGDRFHELIVDEHVSRREDVIARSRESDLGTGVAYAIAYRIAPLGPRSKSCLWVEDIGRWWAGPDGTPTVARGFLRIGEKAAFAARSQAAIDYDELTGQLTRMRLTDALSAVVKRASQSDSHSALLMVAVNNLQRINDSFGYETGDEVLAQVGLRLRSVIRAGDTLGRYSANKFGVILSECTADEVRAAADRLKQVTSYEPVATDACKIIVSVSIGAVLLPTHAANADVAFGRVMRALDEARYNSRDAFAVYEPDKSRDLKRLRSARIADYIDSALSEDRLELALQPIVWSDQRTPAFHECLLRIKDQSDSAFSPADFIPIAEELGLAMLIDQRTLALATAMLFKYPWLKLSLNVSALTCSDSAWLRDLDRRVHDMPGIAPRLVIEITETMAATNLDQTAHFVDMVRDLGCRVAIDDFGAGYTSFANLKRVPADILKIDGSFVQNMMDDRSDRVFVRTMVEIAESFGMETVAEWVGDEETADYIARLGVTYIQGFHFGRPMPIAEVVDAHIKRTEAAATSASRT